MANEENMRRLWLIDASYLFNAQDSPYKGFKFDYLSLRHKLEEAGPIWRAYYLNSIRGHHDDQHQDSFHHWLQLAPPNGPKIITKIYGLRVLSVKNGYCFDCRHTVDVTCPNETDGSHHNIGREQQKGVDVGLATLALTLADEYSTLLLSSGDGDLTDALEYLSAHGSKRLELAVFKSGVSAELQARADEIYWLDDFAEEINRDNSAHFTGE